MYSSYKPKGLVNFAGNCYMNSLLQCLYYCIEFRNKILDIDFKEDNSIVLLLKELFKMELELMQRIYWILFLIQSIMN